MFARPATTPLLVALTALAALPIACSPPAAPHASSQASPPSLDAGASPAPPLRWKRVHHETFDRPFEEPPTWTEDTYGEASPYHIDAFDDDGEYFREHGGAAFAEGLRAFRSYRKSFRHGEGGWITVELYGRDEDCDGTPESGGRFVARDGKAHLASARHTDAAILTSTRPLPPRYRVEVTVSNVRFGGAVNGSFTHDGKINGYDGGESALPWRLPTDGAPPPPATTDNGVYFLCIVDYARPAPHNNVFIHHHRKVVLDTDNNQWQGHSWSKIHDPTSGQPIEGGSHYAGLVFLRGDDFGNDRTGNEFISWTPGGFVDGPVFADHYLPDESYHFSIERDARGFTLTITGRFARSGRTTYRAYRPFEGIPAGTGSIWHYNQTPAEGPRGRFNQTRSYLGKPMQTWPADAAYPDHFLLGDPHINFYEGTADFDDLELWLPEEDL